MEETFDKKPFTINLGLLITIISSTIMLTFTIVSFYFETKNRQADEITQTRQAVSELKNQVSTISTTLNYVVTNQNDMKSSIRHRFKIDSTQIQGLIEDVHELNYYLKNPKNNQRAYSFNNVSHEN